MVKNSLDNSARAENPPYASRIVFTHLVEGYAILRVALGNPFTQCSPSLIHEYLWTLSERIEQAHADLFCEWKTRLQEQGKKSK